MDERSGTAVGRVRFEHRAEALGLGIGSPRLSWQIESDDPGFHVAASEVEVVHDDGRTEVARIDGPEQVLVAWPFEVLLSRAKAAVRARAFDGAAWTAWSEPSPLEVGLLHPDDWTARFVSPRDIGGIGESAPILRRAVELGDREVRSARLYATAHGIYQATINGRPVGDQVLAPGWTSYANRLRYQTYDVTDLLEPGENVLSVLLGNGWYRGRLGFGGERALYGDRLALLAQLEVTYADGSTVRFGTDEAWTAHESQYLADDFYDGQSVDLRRPAVGPAHPVDEIADDLTRLVAPSGPPIRVAETIPAVGIVGVTDEGETLVDFGQNVVGWVRIRLRDTTAGTEVRVRHAEVLEDGELSLRPLRSAQCTDTYVLAGGGEEALEPGLTLHGFRYAGITGVDVTPDAVEAVVVGSDLARTGWFTSSDPLLNQLHDNVVWSMRGNFVDVPTDCPQRDERLGWTGDLQIFAPTACFLFDCAGLLDSWLADLAAEQQPDGSLPMVVPDVLDLPVAAAAWGDAATIVPSVVFERYGDLGLLQRQFASMQLWMDKATSLRGPDGIWAGGFQLGDWLDPVAPPTKPWEATADMDVVATAYLIRSADLLARAAGELGDKAAADRFGTLAESARRAFADAFVTPAGRIISDCPTVYALALVWDLLADDDSRFVAGRRLGDLVRAAGFQVSTGFLGTPLIADALTRSGQVHLAYRMLFETRCPSWLYPVTMGATTIWERWDSMLPDGSINPGSMTSFNHYAFGAVADWLHRSVAGLAPAAPGYQRVVVRPQPGAPLTEASSRHLSPYGEITVAWRRGEGRFRLEVDLPVGVHAEVHVPGVDDVELVGHGHHTWTAADPVAHTALGPDATLREMVDDPDVFGALTDELVERGVGSTRAEVAKVLLGHLDRRPSELPVPLAVAALMVGALDLTEQITRFLPNQRE